MKTLLLFLLSALTVLGQSVELRSVTILGGVEIGQAAAVVSSCTTTNTTNAWDNFLEGFQSATGYDSNGWTHVGVSENIISNYTSTALTNNKPAGACDQCLRVVLDGSATETYAYVDLGVAIDIDTVPVIITLSFLSNVGVTNSGSVYNIFEAGAQTFGGSASFSIQAYNNLGQQQVRISSATNSAYIDVSTNQWYTAVITLDTALTASSTFQLFSGGSQVSTNCPFARAALADIRYLLLGGSYGVDATETGIYNYDILCVNTP